MKANNMKAMREALDEIQDKITQWRNDGIIEHWQYSQLWDIADAALAKPARNCDVYEDEAEARRAFLEGKCEHPCGDCTVTDDEDALCHTCGLEWLFAPANKGETDGGK